MSNSVFDSTFFNVKEVSEHLNLSILTVYRYISEKKLKAIHFGGRYLIEKTSLNSFMEKNKVKKKSPSHLK